jgi:hypothetical protein
MSLKQVRRRGPDKPAASGGFRAFWIGVAVDASEPFLAINKVVNANSGFRLRGEAPERAPSPAGTATIPYPE